MAPDRTMTLGLVLALLSILPIWLVPVAPLSDWPIHLAISREAFLISSGQVFSAHYSVNFQFLGNSFVQLLLMGLQYALPLAVAGQVALSLLFLLSGICWWYFFHTLDPGKEEWFAAGLLMNYSIFSYIGLVNYLFAVNFGLVWLAAGITLLDGRKQSRWLFLIAGTLTYLCHSYTFLLAGGAMLAYAAWRSAIKGEKTDGFSASLLVLMMLLAIASMVLNTAQTRSTDYRDAVGLCMDRMASREYAEPFSPKKEPLELLGGALNRAVMVWPFGFLSSIFPLMLLLVVGVLALLGFGLHALFRFLMGGEPLLKTLKQNRMKPKIGIRPAYAGLAILFLLHYWLAPAYTLTFFMLNERSLIFALAFAMLALEARQAVRPAAWLMLALLAANIAYQGILFYGENATQAQVMAALQAAGEKIGAGEAVFVIPNPWTNLEKWYGEPAYHSPHYSGLLLIYQPQAYVSGLFLSHESFILRSNFSTYDEMTALAVMPSDKKHPLDYSPCYYPVPKEYDWYVDGNITARPNR